MYDNKYNFMYNMIFVSVKLLVGSQPTCRPDCKSHMADHIIFRFQALFCTSFLSWLLAGRLSNLYSVLLCCIECN